MLPALTELSNKPWRNTQIGYRLKVLFLHLEENSKEGTGLSLTNLFLQKSFISCLVYFCLWCRRHFFHSPHLKPEKLGAHSALCPTSIPKNPRNGLTKGCSLKPDTMDSVL